MSQRNKSSKKNEEDTFFVNIYLKAHLDLFFLSSFTAANVDANIFVVWEVQLQHKELRGK